MISAFTEPRAAALLDGSVELLLIVVREVVVEVQVVVVSVGGRRSTRSAVGIDELVEGLAEGVVDLLAEEGRRNMPAVGPS